METIVYQKPETRMDIMLKLIQHSGMNVEELFSMIMEENGMNDEVYETGRSRRGNIYETLCIILILTKCFDGFNYTNVYKNFLHNLIVVTDVQDLLNVAVGGGGNNCADMVFSHTDNPTELVGLSVKYWNKYTDGDCDRIEGHVLDSKFKTIKVALIVKDTDVQKSHHHNDVGTTVYKALSKVYENNLLFDVKDVLKAMAVFDGKCDSFRNISVSMYEHINVNYFNNTRIQLKLKMHQKMTEKLMSLQIKNKNKMFCIAHKPRSGKSITILNICNSLFVSPSIKRILIMTSVPSTIDSFTNDIKKYEEFNSIKYITQDSINQVLLSDFIGIVFCSVQFLKTGTKKDKNAKNKLLQQIGFNVIIADECHHGSSTDKTRDDILDTGIDNDNELNQILKPNRNKLVIFASGTPDKTRDFYNIGQDQTFLWELQDELSMKELSKPSITNEDKTEIIDMMNKRHQGLFTDCYNDISVNKDYSKCPMFYKIPYQLPTKLVQSINDYNNEHNTKYGFSYSSLLSLQYDNDKQNYKNHFLVGDSTLGQKFIKDSLQHLIAGKPAKGAIIGDRTDMMYRIEQTQNRYNSHMSSNYDPKMIIMFLPVNSGTGTIGTLMKTLKEFIIKYNVWDDYNIEYSCSSCDSSPESGKTGSYNQFVIDCMTRTREPKDEKGEPIYKGCILFLGNAGTVGVTYPDCDVTFSLDDGHSIDNQKQKVSRALTERPGKTVGISCDLNIQRFYREQYDSIAQIKKYCNKVMTDAEVLLYGHKHNIILCDKSQLDLCADDKQRLTYLEIGVKEMYKNVLIDDRYILEGIDCDDTMKITLSNMKFMNRQSKKNKNKKTNNEEEQQKCPKGEKTTIMKQALITQQNGTTDSEESDADSDVEIKTQNVIETRNHTKILLQVVIPLLVLATIDHDIEYETEYYRTVMNDTEFKSVLLSLMTYNDKNYKPINIISDIDMMIKEMDKKQNSEIIQRVRYAYKNAKPEDIRHMIANHFVPTTEEKKKNAEISTPITLVDEMLSKFPDELWTKPHKVLEPCCGKGNFVIAIFDKFFIGLQNTYKDVSKRCEVIINECIYYADLSPLNVFIVTELLKHHVEFYTQGKKTKLTFNQHIGDTLEIGKLENKGDTVITNIQKIFPNVDCGFDAVVSNPPYQDTKGNNGTLWDKFIPFSIDTLKQGGYLLTIHPSGWRNVDGKFKKAKKVILSKNLLYLEIHDSKDGVKTFGCGTRYDWYLLKNESVDKTDTVVRFQDGKVLRINVKEVQFIPNAGYEELDSLYAKEGDDKVNLMYSASLYHHTKDHMDKNESSIFKHPVIYTINSKGEKRIHFSSKHHGDEGHYGIQKLIWSNGSIDTCRSYIDNNGKYALTQFAYAIADEQDNLPKIQEAFDSKKFRDLMQFCAVGQQHINYKVIALFKKNFYKEFI